MTWSGRSRVTEKAKEAKRMSNRIPNDPYMLLSYINMMLRDTFDSLEEFCAANDADKDTIKAKLQAAGFEYDRELNQFR